MSEGVVMERGSNENGTQRRTGAANLAFIWALQETAIPRSHHRE
jgi:hypothetical protein